MDSSCIQSESVILKGEYHWKTIPSVGVHVGLFIYYLKGLKVICSASISMPCCMLYGSFMIMVVPQWKFKHWRFIVYVVVNSMNAHVQSWIMKVLKCLINLWLILVTNLISLKIISDSVWLTWSTWTQVRIWIANRKKCFIHKSSAHRFLCSRSK